MLILYTVAIIAAAVLVAALWALKAQPKPKQKVTVKRSVKPVHKVRVPQALTMNTVKPVTSKPPADSSSIPLPIGHPARGFPPLEPYPANNAKQEERKPLVLPAKKQSTPQPSHRTLQLQQQLYQLLQGDKQAAERLIKTAQSRHPGHDPSWYLDKVINDLERDRRR